MGCVAGLGAAWLGIVGAVLLIVGLGLAFSGLAYPSYVIDEEREAARIARPGARVLVVGRNFGCGSSREHAVWVFEVNDINVVIGEGFARIFRQNMFNCGMLAIELSSQDIDKLFEMGPKLEIDVDIEKETVHAKGSSEATFSFQLNSFDKELVVAGGWLAYADKKY